MSKISFFSQVKALLEKSLINEYFWLALYDKSAHMKAEGQLCVEKILSQSSDKMNEGKTE